MQLIYHAAVKQHSSPPCSLSHHPLSNRLFPTAVPTSKHPPGSQGPLVLIAWNLAAHRGCHSPWPASTFITCSCAAQAWTQCGKPIWLGKAKFLPSFLNVPSQPTLSCPLIPSPRAPSTPSLALGRSARECICWGWGFLPSHCCATGKNEIGIILF